MKAYQAYTNGGFRVTRSSPKQAAMAFFEEFTSKRKCNVVEGESKDGFFTVTLSLRKDGDKPSSWRDVTKKQIVSLPD